MWCIFWKYTLKVNVLLIIIWKETFLRACDSLRSGAAPTPINSKMNYVANQLIFKIISVQKFSILVLKFTDFLKNTFDRALLIFEKSGAILA